MRRKTVGALVVGDWNLSHAALERLADRLEGELVVGKHPDHGILLGAARLVRVDRLDPGASDHAPILITLEVGEERVRVLWWNVYVGQAPASVRAHLDGLLDLLEPDVVALGEAYRLGAVLKRVPGYRRQRVPRGEGAELVTLVRRGPGTVTYSGRLRMRERWIGPKHRLPHGPKAYPRLRIRLARRTVLRLLVVHLPTGGEGGPNDAAVVETLDALEGWAR